MTSPGRYIGLMSGTSLDGLDGVLVDLQGPAHAFHGRVQAHAHAPFDPGLRAELLALNTPGGEDELHRAAVASRQLAASCAGVVQRLLAAAGDLTPVRAIGCHGQTVRHRPAPADGGYTLQLNAAAELAERTGLDVVADFRSRDVAAGGQGAPLVPAFHRAAFARPGEALAVLNLGGIANVTLVQRDGRTSGHDTGPANVLIDLWCQRHTGAAHDDGGAWAASGRVDAALLRSLLAEPYFSQPAPKSTGRDLFHAAWLEAQLAPFPSRAPVDVQATLAELTAATVADAVQRGAPDAAALVICGGGARNADLLTRLARRLPGITVTTSDARGVPADQVEALAFAWLARACIERLAGNLPEVTGAAGPRVLGAIWPGR